MSFISIRFRGLELVCDEEFGRGWKGGGGLERMTPCFIDFASWVIGLLLFLYERQLFSANASKLSVLSSVLLVGSLILFDILTNQKDSLGDVDSKKVI